MEQISGVIQAMPGKRLKYKELTEEKLIDNRGRL